MRASRSASVLSALALLTSPVQAGAQAAPQRHHQLRVELGVGSTVGIIGASYAYEPLRWLRLEAGVGAGLSGVQTSLMPKIALGGDHHRATTGAGVSIGWGNRDDKAAFRDYPNPVTWLNVDAAGYEYISDGGFVFTLAIGVTQALEGHARCFEGDHWDCPPDRRIDLKKEGPWPQFRFGLGGRL